MTRRMGTIYTLLPVCGVHDGVHVETCGPNNYIVSVKDSNGEFWHLISISREHAREFIRAWQEHIEEMEDQDIFDKLEAEQ